jgi:transposase
MAPYSMDLRTRVLADRDAGLAAKEVAAKFRVSRSWVDRLVQRRRETGEVVPRQQQVFKKQAFAGQEDRLRALVDAQPDRTLAELREALHSAASLSSLWRALDRLQLTVKKNGTRRRTTAAGRRGRASPLARVAAVPRSAAVHLSR